MNRQLSLSMPSPNSFKFETPGVASVVRERGVRLYDAPSSASPVASFVPMHYESNYAYPLIVWLHGTEQSERDLPHVMRHVSTRNYVAVAPRGVREQGDAYAWSDSAEAVEEAQARVFDAIDFAQERLSIHPDRVFLAGVGCGGTLALRLALQHPQEFTGAASFDGALPSGRGVLRNLDALRSLPLLLAGSRDSRAYPEARLCSDLRLLHSAGATLSIRQYPGSDDLTTAMLADLDRWLMEIVCGAPAKV